MILLLKQLYGCYGRHGEYKHGKVVSMRNGEALVAWVASGNAKVVPEPKRKWKSNEVSKLKE